MSTNKEDIAGGIGCFIFIFCPIVWFFFTVILVYFPATEDPDCHSTSECNSVLTACLTAFHTDNVLLKKWKGGSLSVYVDQHKFEDIPFPDRDRMLKPIVEGWCKYNGGPLLPSLWFVDVRTGYTLKNYGCFGITLSRMWEEASISKSSKPRQEPVPKNETPEEQANRLLQKHGFPPLPKTSTRKAEPPSDTAETMEEKVKLIEEIKSVVPGFTELPDSDQQELITKALAHKAALRKSQTSETPEQIEDRIRAKMGLPPRTP